jgi:hypothetical protein
MLPSQIAKSFTFPLAEAFTNDVTLYFEVKEPVTGPKASLLTLSLVIGSSVKKKDFGLYCLDILQVLLQDYNSQQILPVESEEVAKELVDGVGGIDLYFFVCLKLTNIYYQLLFFLVKFLLIFTLSVFFHYI